MQDSIIFDYSLSLPTLYLMIHQIFTNRWVFPGSTVVKNLPAMRETWVLSLGWEDALEKGMATHSSFLPGKSHGQRNLVGYSPWSPTRIRHGLVTKQQPIPESLWSFLLSCPLCLERSLPY